MSQVLLLMCHRDATGAFAASAQWHIMRQVESSTWYKVEQLDWPVDWVVRFGRSGPLVIEIGFGSGLFLAALARNRPEANIIGIEISVPSLRNAARKIQRAGLENVILIQSDARSALQVLCVPDSVESVFINYPDPWPKKDHSSRRLIDDEFLELLATRLEKGGVLDIATDHEEYATQINDCLQRDPHFSSTTGVAYSHIDTDRVVTKYEQVALAEGRTPHYFKWQRNGQPIENRFHAPKELSMPHVVLRVPADLNGIGHHFRPSHVETDSGRIRFIDLYQSVSDGKLLIETYINEGAIQQRIGIEIRARSTGEVVISLAEVGFPRPTHGVHLAISALVDWLREVYPSLIVVHTTLVGHHADTPDKRN